MRNKIFTQIYDEVNKNSNFNGQKNLNYSFSRNEKENQPVKDQSSGAYFRLDLTKNDKVFDIPANVPAFSKDKETDYSCISYLTSARKPDVYAGSEVISAKFYKIVNNNNGGNRDKEIVGEKINFIDLTEDFEDTALNVSKSIANQYKNILNKADEEDKQTKIIAEDKINETENESEIASRDEEKVKKKERRYFSSKDISVQCYNCNEYGHISKSCPNEVVIICHRCNHKGHIEEDCPNTKCFKCNRIGHKSFECKIRSNEIEKCENCKNIGHLAEDCLIKPLRIKKSQMKNTICQFCGKNGHFICPKPEKPHIITGYISEEVVLSESEEENESEDDFYSIIRKQELKNRNLQGTEFTQFTKKKHKRVLSSVANKDILQTIFCPKCAEPHKMEDCNLQIRTNIFDQRRQIYSKTLFYDNKSKKYLFLFNVINFRKKDYNSDDYSSDRSITEELKKHRRVPILGNLFLFN